MGKLTLKDLEVKGRRVFVRLDLNVPLDKEGRVADDTRIAASLPTIRYVIERGGRAILASHLGRPDGKRDERYSLRPVALRLEELLKREVKMAENCIGAGVKALVDSMKEGDAVLLENLRFHPGETADDPDFARALGELADLYVDDAFGAAHRAHASVRGITEHVAASAAGLLMGKELEYLGRLLTNPPKPFVACLGGAKVKDKIGPVASLLDRVDAILIGGKMSYTFLSSRGERFDPSLVEPDRLRDAENILKRAGTKGVKVSLPLDHVVAREIKAGAETMERRGEEIPSGWTPVDIGPETIRAFTKEISGARTIFWNGPMGISEVDDFSRGTLAVAKAVAGADALTVIGGGDTVLAARKAGTLERYSHVSTGGGASLEFLEGKVLPGVKALSEK